MASSDVQIDRSKNKSMLIYFAVLGVAGLVIVIFTVIESWGFWGWLGGGLLLFTSLGSMASMKKTGGAGLANCPSCGHATEVLHITEHRYFCCAGCKTWLHGSSTIEAVAEDHVAKYAAFDLELAGTSVVWPEDCPVCGGVVTRTVELEGTDVVGDAFAMVAPVAIQGVSKLEVPCCGQHDDGVALRREGGRAVVSFRSLSYWRRFMSANGLQPRVKLD